MKNFGGWVAPTRPLSKKPKPCTQDTCCHWNSCPFGHDQRACLHADTDGDECLLSEVT